MVFEINSFFILPIITYFLFTTSFVQAGGRNQKSGTTGDEWDRGTFQNPSKNVRPKFRYWAPDAYIDDSRIDFDLEQLQKVGMGGFELICFQLYGDPTPSVYGYEVVDWGQYGFGSKEWKNKVGVFASAAQRYQLNMDFALGPNQGAGIPVETPNSPGLSTGLEYGHTTIKGGQTYSGVAPSPDLTYGPTYNLYWEFPDTQISPAKLVAASAGRISRVSGKSIYLDEKSMVDLSDRIKNGSITFTAPGNDTDEWYIFSFWQRRTGQLEARGGLNGSSSNAPASYGSYIVDHFSATGAKLSTDFMDQYDFITGDLKNVGMYAWEDSIELLAPLFWTDSLMQDFMDRRGYSPVQYLPIFYKDYSARTFLFDTTDQGASYITDYHQTLTEKYIEYVSVFKEWAHLKGIQYSNQPAYNLPLDVTAASAIPDAPECESLAFADYIDAYRQFAGGVNMANARIMSSENGARISQLYSYTWPQILYDIRTNWAGGVNQLVIHGSPYSGNYPNTTWPGYTAFIWEGYAGSHNIRQPAWEHYRAIIDHIARTQFSLQAGVPKIDLAIYRYRFDETVRPIWKDLGLWNKGYTWNYLSPANLDLPSATIQEASLANDGPSYKAFLIDNEVSITVGAATHLAEYADAGFPIIFIGPIPSSTPGHNITGDAYVKSTVNSILVKKNVIKVATEADVVGALGTLGIKPFCGSSFVCVHRWDKAENLHYVFFYNQANTSNQEVTLQTTGTPFVLDNWSGEIRRIAEYKEDSNSITFKLSLAATATALVAIGDPTSFGFAASNLKHAIPSTFGGNLTYDANDLVAKSFQSQTTALSLSNDTQVPIQISVKESLQTLNSWQLKIEDWGPTSNYSDATSHSTKIHQYNISSVASWDEIDPALKFVSGIGDYQTTFTWNGTSDSGLILTTGHVFHTMSAKLNGHALNAFEPYDPWLDVTSYLVRGKNLLEIQVATTLQNRLLDLPFEIKTSGMFPNPPYAGRVGANQKYGLTGPVKLIPYGIARVRLD